MILNDIVYLFQKQEQQLYAEYCYCNEKLKKRVTTTLTLKTLY